MTHREILESELEVIRSSGSRKLYLILGKKMGMHVPQTLVALDEREFEEHKKIFGLVVEIGDAHPDLAQGIEWEVCGIRRIDVAGLPGNPMRKRGEDL